MNRSPIWPPMLLTVSLLLVALPGKAFAQADQMQIDAVEDEDYPTIELTVTVPEQLAGAALPPDAFEISENGQSRGRPSLGRAPGTSQPAAPRIVLAIDTSGSMDGDPITLAKAAARDFVQDLRQGSEVAVVTFDASPGVALDFTTDVADALAAIDSIDIEDPNAGTALYDGVERATRVLSGTRQAAPESIVVLSDGGDRDSQLSQRQAVRAVSRSGAALWAVALESGDANADALAALAGDRDRVLAARDATELGGIYSSLAADLSRQYLLRYESEVTGATDITVTVDYGQVNATGTLAQTIEGTPQQDAAPPQARVIDADPFVERVPLLGTTPALGTGLGALAAASLLIWFTVLTRPPPRTRERLSLGTSPRPHLHLSGVAEWASNQAERSLRGRRLGSAIDNALEEAGVNLRPGEFVVIVASLMFVAYALGVALANPLIGLMLAVLVPAGARVLLSIRRDRRQAAFADQITDVLQLIAGSLRAGYGLLQGIDAVARDAAEPAASEFHRVLIEHRLGRNLNDAMENCARRMANDDFAWVVQAIGIHREVGGDLARVLDNIVATVRERADVHRQVRALSTEGRMSAVILSALPFVTMTAIQLLSPNYLEELTSRAMGWVLLAAAGLSLAIGVTIVRRLVKIEY